MRVVFAAEMALNQQPINQSIPYKPSVLVSAVSVYFVEKVCYVILQINLLSDSCVVAWSLTYSKLDNLCFES